MRKLLIFTRPENVKATFQSDFGPLSYGVPDTDSTGRKGISFVIPDNIPNGNGAYLSIEADGCAPYSLRGKLFLHDWPTSCEFNPDDYMMFELPKPAPVPDPTLNPRDILFEVTLNSDEYDLTTKEGCGQYTEAACKALHEQHSPDWKHVKKNPGQNQYNGHAVDAIVLEKTTGNCWSGIYDLIIDAAGPDAAFVDDAGDVVFNRVGDATGQGYYPPA